MSASGVTLDDEGVVLSEMGHVRVTTPDGIIIITRLQGMGTGISVYEADEEPLATFYLKERA